MSEQVLNGIGEQLRERREALGYTLKEVAEQTRIRKVYLTHIEGEEFNALPGDAYVKGFIRAYARFLKMPADPLVQALYARDVPPSHDDQESSLTPAQAPVSLPAAKPHGDWSMFFVGLIVVMLLGGALYFLLDVVNFS